MIGAALCAMIRRAAHGPMGVTAMGIVEKTQASAPVADFDRFSIAPFRRRAGRWAVGSCHGREIVLALDALRQKRSRSRRRGALFHEIRIAHSRAMGEIA
jgi:hypothetical protein